MGHLFSPLGVTQADPGTLRLPTPIPPPVLSCSPRPSSSVLLSGHFDTSSLHIPRIFGDTRAAKVPKCTPCSSSGSRVLAHTTPQAPINSPASGPSTRRSPAPYSLRVARLRRTRPRGRSRAHPELFSTVCILPAELHHLSTLSLCSSSHCAHVTTSIRWGSALRHARAQRSSKLVPLAGHHTLETASNVISVSLLSCQDGVRPVSQTRLLPPLGRHSTALRRYASCSHRTSPHSTY